MGPEILGLIGLAVMAGVVVLIRRIHLQAEATERLSEALEAPQFADGNPRRRARRYLRRYWLAPWLLASITFVLLHYTTTLNPIFNIAVAVVVVLIGSQLEQVWAERRKNQIEVQLADAVDLMVGALQAGVGVLSAMDQAAQESPRLLKTQLDEVVGRIRFGDDPQTVFQGLIDRVPLETFRLLATALAVHWEVGGSLAPTLASVGRTIRDRIEMSRRIRSMTTQARVSIITVVCLTYFIALAMWRLNPGHMLDFVSSPHVQAAIAFTIVMQAIGVVWALSMSRPKF